MIALFHSELWGSGRHGGLRFQVSSVLLILPAGPGDVPKEAIRWTDRTSQAPT